MSRKETRSGSEHVRPTKSDNLRKTAELYYEATLIPVSCFEGGSLLFSCTHPLQDYNLPLLLFSSLTEYSPDGSDRKERGAGEKDSLPGLWYSFTPEFLYFGGVRVSPSRTLVLGPLLLSECSIRQASAICARIGRRESDFSSLQRYFHATGPHRVPSLLANLTLLAKLLGRQADERHIPLLPFDWNLPYPTAYHTPRLEPEDELTPNVENALLSCVRTGNLDKLNRYMNSIINAPELAGDMSLASMRSYILGANMLASRTARLAGVDYRRVNNIAGKYIDQILQARTSSDLTLLFFRSFQEYTELVARLYDLPSGSPIVRSVHQYIATHYEEKITPRILAEKLRLNVSYLCAHFKKETGMTISTYVQKEKIREAKRLLEGSSDSLSEISAALGFSSQSYFGKIFKKETGRTPQSYRLNL